MQSLLNYSLKTIVAVLKKKCLFLNDSARKISNLNLQQGLGTYKIYCKILQQNILTIHSCVKMNYSFNYSHENGYLSTEQYKVKMKISIKFIMIFKGNRLFITLFFISKPNTTQIGSALK